jgi:hypothetical protein
VSGKQVLRVLVRLGPRPDTLPAGQQDLYIHSHSFPHIPKNQLQLSESAGPHRTDIYENPSEHYASIGHYAVAPGPTPRTAGPNFYGYGMLEKPKLIQINQINQINLKCRLLGGPFGFISYCRLMLHLGSKSLVKASNLLVYSNVRL